MFPTADPWHHDMAIHGMNRCSALLHCLATWKKKSAKEITTLSSPHQDLMERATDVEVDSLALTNR